MKILVTGHRGYIGQHLFKRLEQEGHDVHGIDMKEGQDILHNLPATPYDIVFHMAAFPRVGYSIENPSYTMRHNVYATSKLLEWSKTNGVKRFIFSSSSAIYGDGGGPNSPYGLHKLMSEQECRLYSEVYKLDTVCLRYFNVYSKDQEYGGSYSTIISAWLEMMKQNAPLRIDGTGEQSRDFVHVDDVVEANLFCMNYKSNFDGAHFDVGSGEVYSINEIKNLILSLKRVTFIDGPKRLGDVLHTSMTSKRLSDLGWTAKNNFKNNVLEYFKEVI